MFFFFFFNDTATTEIYTLSLHDALPIYTQIELELRLAETIPPGTNTFTLISPDGESKPHPMLDRKSTRLNSSHTVISYAVFCLKKKKKITTCAHESTSYCSKSLIHSYDR